MKTLIVALSMTLTVGASSALAFDSELQTVNETAFDTVDANGDGQVSRREIDHYRALVMLSQDSDDDGIVTFDEYNAWDMGWREVAKSRGKIDQLKAARAQVFDYWDKNNDGRLSPEEQLMSQTVDFYAADVDRDHIIDFDAFTTRLRIISAMNDAVTGTTPVTLINVFEVPPEKLDETIAMWEEARDFLQTQPGYISTALHRSIMPDARFQLINVAYWRDALSFKNATMAMRENAGISAVDGLHFNAALYQITRQD